eukprot:gene3797-4147_t
MVDYRKFDHILDSDDEEDSQPIVTAASSSSTTTTAPAPAPVSASLGLPPSVKPGEVMTKKGKEGRLRFEYEGRTVYEWEQSLTEVNIFIDLPPQVTKKMLDISISPNHLRVGMKGQSPYIDEDTGGGVIVGESMWLIDDGEVNINLQKMNKAEAWDCALRGRAGSTLDSYTKEEVRKKILLERFQEEHPGFDFSGAEFNGQVPDAREFMGGVKHF